MANNLFVTYRLQTPMSSAQEVESAITRLGTAVRLLPGTWYLNSGWSAGDVADELRRGMDPADLLLVIDASNNELARFGVSCDACEAMEDLWEG